MIPLMLLSGFFASSDNYAPYLKPFEYISTFKYSYQILTQIEFKDLKALTCSNLTIFPCDPLTSRFTFNEEMWVSILLIANVSFCLNVFAYLIMYFKTRIRA